MREEQLENLRVRHIPFLMLSLIHLKIVHRSEFDDKKKKGI